MIHIESSDDESDNLGSRNSNDDSRESEGSDDDSEERTHSDDDYAETRDSEDGNESPSTRTANKTIAMDMLITHTAAEDVEDKFKETAKNWPVWDSRTHPQAPPKSGKFLFKYNGDYETERVLIMSGKATLSPTDGSEPITIAEGDQVFFHKGFACNWHVTEPMKKHYAHYDEDGVQVAANPSIACDICEVECYEESYLTEEEEDICLDCYKADKKQYAGAEHQKFGEPLLTKEKGN